MLQLCKMKVLMLRKRERIKTKGGAFSFQLLSSFLPGQKTSGEILLGGAGGAGGGRTCCLITYTLAG